MHQHQQRFGVLVLHDQGFDHCERVQPQHLGAVLCTAVFKVFVGVFGIGPVSYTHLDVYKRQVQGVSGSTVRVRLNTDLMLRQLAFTKTGADRDTGRV